MTEVHMVQFTDPACCGIRRVDEDGCCIICGRDFMDPETGEEVGDGSRVPNQSLAAAAPEMVETLEGVLGCAPSGYAPDSIWATIAAVIAKAKGAE